MANQQISLSLKEIYVKLCPKCAEVLRGLIKDKLTDQAVKEALEGEEKV